MTSSGDRCPDPEVLGSLIEGTLDEARRTEVIRHVEACPDCLAVVGETATFLRGEDRKGDEEEESEDSKLNERSALWPIAVASALVCLAIGLWQLSGRDPLEDLKAEAARLAVRPVEGQLDGFAYRRYSVTRSGRADSEDFSSLRARARRLIAEDARDARSLHVRGVALLLDGEEKQAVAALEEATRLAPNEGSLWNDLAVAELALADARFDDEALAAAVVAAGRALVNAPDDPAALFNRGVAYEHQQRSDLALADYRRCVAAGGASAWSGEARERAERLAR